MVKAGKSRVLELFSEKAFGDRLVEVMQEMNHNQQTTLERKDE